MPLHGFLTSHSVRLSRASAWRVGKLRGRLPLAGRAVGFTLAVRIAVCFHRRQSESPKSNNNHRRGFQILQAARAREGVRAGDRSRDSSPLRKPAAPRCWSVVPGTIIWGGKSQLSGPENDVVLVSKVLRDHYQLTDADITVLAESAGPDNRPTKANIQRAFAALAKSTRPHDQVLILLAGHGSQQPDEDPPSADDPEPDGLDETFLPADVVPMTASERADWRQLTNAITDDEIFAMTKEIATAGASVWIIFDSCHSGTGMRGSSDEQMREVPVEDLAPRDALKPARSRRRRYRESRRGRPAPRPTSGTRPST